MAREIVPPYPHPSGARPPQIPKQFVPRHVAVVMDGNGRWANARGLPRVEGHRAGEASLLDVVAGAIEIGVQHVSREIALEGCARRRSIASAFCRIRSGVHCMAPG